MLTELGVTAEVLRANIDWKSCLNVAGQFRPNFNVEGDVPANHFCRDR